MRLLAPTTFQEAFLDALSAYPVRWVYGSLPQDPAGRASKWLPSVDVDGLAEHVADLRSRGIGFMYTMNAACSANREFTAEGQRELAERLGLLIDVGATGVVATSPYLIEMVRERYPDLRVCVSTLANVDDVDKALFFERLGANTIYLPEYINRDFRLLRALRRRVGCDLILTVNLGCLLHCPLRDYHATVISHSAASLERGCYVDYSLAKCTAMKAAAPTEMIKAPWIRPEDLAVYESIGYGDFKLAGRENGAEWVLRAVNAYATRRYSGDLNDIVIGFETLEPYGRLPVRIDNTKLDGFVEFFERRDCRLGCGDCTHCEGWAERAIHLDGEPGAYAATVARGVRRFTSGAFRAPVSRPS